jgi:hypothetical protein
VADASRGRKHFFLKKEAKTLVHLAYPSGQRERLINKSFLVLFCKKELLACCLFAASTGRLWQDSLSSQPGITLKQRILLCPGT